MRRAVALVIAAVALAGCTSTPTAPPTAGTASWILTKAALDAVTANPQARARLAGTRIFEILKGNEKPSTTVPVVPTLSFKSVATLQQTLDARTPQRRGVRAIIYDAEHWAQTPADEQRDPAGAYQRAATIAHAHGLIFIATPAMDLVNTTGRVSDPASVFLSRGIDGDAAKYADVVDIQAQSLERDTAAYQDFVVRATAQIRSANQGVTVIAGLSTNPHGWVITPDMLVSDMTAVAGSVSGFWLNIPDQGPDCADCATPRPDVAVGALTDGRLGTLFGG
ncbi:MAG TPA: hypothetical protein VH352_00305 [Pseudonocardiaceae bacterium]|jgi:hypothetical protein|nr:hypothetical protein [Pseudonocardiaceae bacterium]